MAHKVKNNHYVATHRSGVDSPSSGGYIHRASSREENDSHRAPSERTLSEYTTMDERTRSPSGEHRNGRRHQHTNGSPRADSGSDVYVTSAAYRPPSEISRQSRAPRSVYSYRSAVAPSVASTHRSKVSRKAGVKVDAMAAPNPFCPNVKGMCCLMLLLNLGLILVTLGFVIVLQFFEPLFVCRQSRAPRSVYSYRSAVAPSVASTHRSKVSRKAGVKVDAMAAPNPFCPNVKGMCCLMLLLNLGLILVTLGFVIVLQFFEPLFVWILGIVFLIFGFITLVGSLIYCVVLCRENPYPRYPDDFYWTHHWSKTIGPSEIHYSASEKQYIKNGNSDRYNKYNGKYSDRESAKGYSDRESKLSRY
uniref:Uncharacterized protein n=2 Tax=Obtectomera TaxID=104431 RepID=A0A2A4KAQ1_HELVI